VVALIIGLGSLLIAVVGILVTIRQRKKTSISYCQIDPGSIFAKSIQEMPKLKILYDNAEVSDHIIFLRILVSNDGNNDIEKSAIYMNL
jgi:hypothetical protein